MSKSRLFGLLRGTVEGFIKDDCASMAAGIAYYGFFSVFPLLLGLISILGFVVEPQLVQEQIQQVVKTYLPTSGEIIFDNIRGALGARGTAGPIVILGLLWSALGIFSAINRGVNLAWGVSRPRSFFRQKLVELTMFFAVGLLLLVSLLATAVLKIVHLVEVPILSGTPYFNGVLWDTLAVVTPFVFTVAVFFWIYRFLPHAPVHSSDALPGALLAAILFELAKNAFAWYVQNLANYQLVYSSLAAVVIFLFWIYVSGIILLFGAEFAAAFSLVFGSRREISGS